MNAIAAAELRMLVRNRTVAACALLVPFALAAFFIFMPGAYGTGGTLAGMQVLLLAGMGVYVTATTTLASRRQSLYLKRLRSGAVADRAIIAGLVGPLVLVNLATIAIVHVVIAMREMPVHAWLVPVGVLVAQLMFAGLALATAGVTSSPEHAQYTTLPVFLLAAGAGMWSTFGVSDQLPLQRALPGGAAMELVELAWNGGALADAPLLAGISLAWAAIGVGAARLMFRWEPRR